MEWFFLALAAPVLFAISSVTDKIIFNKYKISALSSLILIRLMSIPFTFLLLFFVNPAFDIFMVFGILHGFIHSAGSFIFNKAMIKDEVSRVSALFYTNPIFIAILATIFLGEMLTISNYIGILMLVFSAVLISYKKQNGKILLTAGLFLVLLSALIRSALNVFVKWSTISTSVYSFILWSFLGSIIVALLLLVISKPKKDFIKAVKKLDRHAWIIEIIGNSATWIATALFFVAISLSQVSLASAIPSLQPFFVLLYVLLLGIFAPEMLKEENNKQTVFLKLLAVALIFIGSYLIVI